MVREAVDSLNEKQRATIERYKKDYNDARNREDGLYRDKLIMEARSKALGYVQALEDTGVLNHSQASGIRCYITF